MSFRKPCYMPFRKLNPPFTLTDLRRIWKHLCRIFYVNLRRTHLTLLARIDLNLKLRHNFTAPYLLNLWLDSQTYLTTPLIGAQMLIRYTLVGIYHPKTRLRLSLKTEICRASMCKGSLYRAFKNNYPTPLTLDKSIIILCESMFLEWLEHFPCQFVLDT